MTTPEIPKSEGASEQPVDQIVEPEKPETEIAQVEEQVATQTTAAAIAQAADDQSQQQPVGDDSAQVVMITVPATPQQLADWSKGSPDESLTWVAFYWIRMIKKALLHGYRVVTQVPQIQNA